MNTVTWLAAGTIAGVADYGLGLGFGLAASILLVTLLGADPRSVAGAAALAQVATAIPATLAHRRRGNIGRSRGHARIALVVAASATLSAALSAALLSRVQGRAATLLYAAALAALTPAALYGGFRRSRVRRPLAVAAVAGAAAGFEKAMTGGGFSVLIAAAQAAAGVDVKAAIAMTPVVKMPPFILIAAIYGVHGFFSLMHAAALAAGALLSLPVASRLLERAKAERIAVLHAAVLAAAALQAAVRALYTT